MSVISERKSNIKRAWGNPRARFSIIAMSALALIMLVFAWVNSGDQRPAQAGTGTRSVEAPNVEARPGSVNDPNYVRAVRDENQDRLDAARAAGTTVLPTLEGSATAPSLDPLANAQAPATGAPSQVVQPQPVVVVPQPVPVDQGQPQVQAAPSGRSGQDVTQTKRYKSVESQITAYMSTFAGPTPGQEFAYNGKMPEVAPAPAAPADGLSVSAGNSQAPAERSGARFVRAGTIVPAVLLTSINSDTPGPVLAQITSGPLAGARVLGSFQASEKEVVVQFRTLSMPGESSSFSMNAYAVNENLGTGLATDVNNHYFRRYGLMLAAGFIQGYGQAIARTGTTTTIGDSGSVVVVQDELDSSQISKVALGQAGATVAGDLQQETNVRPTVKVEGKDGSGVPIGLLFMNDF